MRSEDGTPGTILLTRAGSFGDAASALLLIAAVSGVILAVPYDSSDAYASLATVLITNPAGVYFRNLHYWAGQLFLIATVLHVWDHLRARTEGRVRPGMWLRLAVTAPLTVFVMLSGFLLRGDTDAQQALRIMTEATAQIPLVGEVVATLIFGAAGRLDIVYVQHAATATMAVWLFTIEHSRRVWPRPVPALAAFIVTSALSLTVSPGLHDGIDPVVKGPWYFLGLQEALHWTSWPPAVVLLGLVLTGALFALRLTPPDTARRIKTFLLGIAVGYAVLCGIGMFFRGANWSWSPGWPSGSGNLRVGWVFATPDVSAVPTGPLPRAMGRPEGCLVCHPGVEGLGKAHRPDAVGCASCHGGDTLTLVTARAHREMESLPGNLATAALRCGLSACHPTVVPRVEGSLMTTMAGVVAVDREVFGEPAGGRPGAPPHVRDLGASPADRHLRQLCASCHLGQPKTAFGPNEEDARGGGCLACHLSYSPAAFDALHTYESAKTASGVSVQPPRVHPAISLDTSNAQCFGCHSRSGRISTNYEGWHEMHAPPAWASDPERPGPSTTRVLADGRGFERVLPDVHQQLGMECIDCHTATEIMGDGTPHTRKHEALKVACQDCHTPPGATFATVGLERLDPESRRILAIRQWPGPAPTAFALTRTGEPLVNVAVGTDGSAALIRKRTGERRPLKRTRDVCVEGRGHERLSCGSCHTAWAPRCPTCHTTFDARADAYDWLADADVRGAWKEQAGPFAANPPTLGVRRTAAGTPGELAVETIETFVPGMVMTLDRRQRADVPADTLFRRLYARVEPHTTRREARSCVSCHNDPEAIGYGQGSLRFEREGRTGRWRFVPARAVAAADGLPADAWIPFLGTRQGPVSTRDDVRPFTVAEQRRILEVGACLTCHRGDSRVMRDAIRDMPGAVRARGRFCVVASWQQ